MIDAEIAPRQLDVAFIDSRQGTALPGIRFLQSNLNPGGIVYCHDILNDGKGAEVLEYLQDDPEKYGFQVLDTGLAGTFEIGVK